MKVIIPEMVIPPYNEDGTKKEPEEKEEVKDDES
jgi:hypothetical protein